MYATGGVYAATAGALLRRRYRSVFLKREYQNAKRYQVYYDVGDELKIPLRDGDGKNVGELLVVFGVMVGGKLELFIGTKFRKGKRFLLRFGSVKSARQVLGYYQGNRRVASVGKVAAKEDGVLGLNDGDGGRDSSNPSK